MAKEKYCVVKVSDNFLEFESDSKKNPPSKVVEKYAFTSEELLALQELKNQSALIQNELEAIALKQAEIRSKKVAIKELADPELQALLSDKLNKNNKHDISCTILRKENLLVVNIGHTDKRKEVYQFFNTFLKFKFEVKNKYQGDRFNRDYSLKVTIDLNDRDNLVEGLKSSKTVLNMPSPVIERLQD